MPLDYNKIMNLDKLWRVILDDGTIVEGGQLPWRQIADVINSKKSNTITDYTNFGDISSHIKQFYLIPWNIGIILDKSKRLIFVAKNTIIKNIQTGEEIKSIKFLIGYQQTKNKTNFKSIIEIDEVMFMKDTDGRND